MASARVRAAAAGIGRNLVEARLHEHGLHEIVGPNGMPSFLAPSTLRLQVEHDLVELHVVGFFRAVGSVLDCAAAVLIGAARLPMSIARADINDVLQFEITPKLIRRRSPTERQISIWEAATFTVRDEAARHGPTNWLAWVLEMRNAYVHRGRPTTRFHNRGSLLTKPMLVETKEPVEALVRFEPHLLKRPWLNDVQVLLDHGPSDQTLPEPAQETLTSTRKTVAAWCEAISAWVLDVWSDSALQADLPVYADAWRERANDFDFAGFSTDAPRKSDLAVISPNEMELFMTAKRLVEEGHTSVG